MKEIFDAILLILNETGIGKALIFMTSITVVLKIFVSQFGEKQPKQRDYPSYPSNTEPHIIYPRYRTTVDRKVKKARWNARHTL